MKFGGGLAIGVVIGVFAGMVTMVYYHRIGV